MFFRIICSELLRRFTEETFLFEIYFHFSSMKTFPFGLFLIGHISVFQLNDPKSMNFFYNFWIFRISCVIYLVFLFHKFSFFYILEGFESWFSNLFWFKEGKILPKCIAKQRTRNSGYLYGWIHLVTKPTNGLLFYLIKQTTSHVNKLCCTE